MSMNGVLIGFDVFNDLMKLELVLGIRLVTPVLVDLARTGTSKKKPSLAQLTQDVIGKHISFTKVMGLVDWKKRPLSRLLQLYAGDIHLFIYDD